MKYYYLLLHFASYKQILQKYDDRQALIAYVFFMRSKSSDFLMDVS